MSHIPVRTCAGCRSRRDRPDLLRVAVVDGVATLDLRGIFGGRGAYLCAATAESCLEKAARNRGLARTLRASHGVIDNSGIRASIVGRLGNPVITPPITPAEETPPSPPR